MAEPVDASLEANRRRLPSQPAYAEASLSPQVFLPLAMSHPPDPTPSPGFQPSYPIRAGFFYPWYPQAWTQSYIFPYTNYHPSFGNYSSIDDALIDAQLRLIAKAHLTAMISSWWGQGPSCSTAGGTPEDQVRAGRERRRLPPGCPCSSLRTDSRAVGAVTTSGQSLPAR